MQQMLKHHPRWAACVASQGSVWGRWLVGDPPMQRQNTKKSNRHAGASAGEAVVHKPHPSIDQFLVGVFLHLFAIKTKKQTNKQTKNRKKEEKKHRDISSGGRKVSSAQVKILLQARPDPSKESSRGRSAVDFAKEADVFGSHQPVLAAPWFHIYRFFCFLYIDSKNGELFAGLDGSMVSFGGILLRLV